MDSLISAPNRAAVAMAAALTPDQIFVALAVELEALGLSCFLLPLDESRQNLQTSYVSMKAKALRVAEKLAGFRGEMLSLPNKS